jgi:hypothetical protein
MRYLPPFALFSARTAVEEDRVGDHVRDWVRTLEALRDGRLDLDAARDLPKLNGDLERLIRKA